MRRKTEPILKTRGEFQNRHAHFDGLVLTAEDDRFEYGEVRKNSIGMIENALILVVTHTDRAGKSRMNAVLETYIRSRRPR